MNDVSTNSPSHLAAGLVGQFDRLPPHSVEAEMCFIACLLLAPDRREEYLGAVRSDQFFQTDHQLIFDSVKEKPSAFSGHVLSKKQASLDGHRLVRGSPHRRLLPSPPAPGLAVDER